MLTRALQAPALWPLTVAAASMGFAEALEACADREVPVEVEAALQAAGYTVADLPHWQDVRRLLEAIKLEANARTGEPLQETAQRCGLTVREAIRAKKVQARYGCILGSFGVWDDRVRHRVRRKAD